MNALAKLIEGYRHEHGLSMQALAKQWGIPRQTLTQLVQREDMKDPPREQTLQRLALGLGMDAHELRKTVAEVLGYSVVRMQLSDDAQAVAIIMDRELDAEKRAAVLRRAKALAEEAKAEVRANESPRGRRKRERVS